MSAMSRFGPSMARTMLVQQHRHMASATGTQLDPIQKLFLDKIKEFKTSNKGLDERYARLMGEEMTRLKRVYKVDDENKLARIEAKYPNEIDVALHDLDSSKELREKIYSGEVQKQLDKPKQKSALLESIPYREPDEFHLPLMNKPHKGLLYKDPVSKISPLHIGGAEAEYTASLEKVTPEHIEREMRVHFGDTMPTIDDDKSPQRDLVNFPRINQQLNSPPTVGHIIPESWFKFFHTKTGITGGYAFGAGFITFLLSKEWLVFEHELLSGLSLICLWAYLIPKYGPAVTNYLNKNIDKEIDNWTHWRKVNMETLTELKESLKTQLGKGDLLDELYNARRQDVEMQLELEHRSRMKAIYEDTKRRLNYLVAVADSKRQIHQDHMVNWVISNVHNAIGPKQEEEYLNNCIGSLKQLSQKNVNAI